MKKRFTEEQIIGALKEAEAGMKVSELCKINRHGLPNQSHRAACTPFRKSRALTQAQLAMHLGVRQSRVADIEATPGKVSLENLRKVFAALDVRVLLRDADAEDKSFFDGKYPRSLAELKAMRGRSASGVADC